MRRRVLVSSVVAALGCSSSAPSPTTPSTPTPSTYVSEDVPDRFEDLAAFVANQLYRMEPARAVSLGIHKLDGKLPDITPAGLEDQRKRLERARDALVKFDDAALTPLQRVERDVLLYEIRGRLFRLVDLDVYRTNPMTYAGHINLDAYILRDYAPVETRASAAIELCTQLPGFLAQARTNLQPPLVRTFVDTALGQTRGYVEFADKDVRQAFTSSGPLANQAELDAALDTCKAALTEHAAWLEQQQARATDAFALGEEKFLKMLAETQGVELELERLRHIAERDLARNLDAMNAAARAIDPKRTTAEVVAAQAQIRPTASTVIGLATQQAQQMRVFVTEHELVSIPSDDVATVRESPPFQRWNSAFLDSAGPFETKPLPSYYYISPPDPSWPVAEQLAYLPPTMDLLFTTIHEVYPGHFLHKLHLRKNPSRILQSFCTYSNSEGWAHYTEEMMFDAGVAGATPEARIGMLKEALLRNARFVATLGLHTAGMTVDQAMQVFVDRGFVDAGNARQQAVRGTFDPMYLAYTLGKLMIQKLRDDWMQANPGKTLGEFHDAFLSYACAPVPVIRRAMLGPDAGPPL
jgi:uncharacterized protein (DUF885 family)